MQRSPQMVIWSISILAKKSTTNPKATPSKTQKAMANSKKQYFCSLPTALSFPKVERVWLICRCIMFLSTTPAVAYSTLTESKYFWTTAS